MGKVLSLIGRPLRNFNLESRAHKVISKDKPTAAPKHKSDQIDYDRIMKEHPEVYEESLKKDKQLDIFLKDVYVQSHDPISPQKSQPNPERPLPLDRSQVTDFEYGIKEPEKIPSGKTTLRNALQFITDHQTNPKLHSVKKIALDHSIPEETIIYEIYVPEQRKVKAKFAGPSVPRIRITREPRKQLLSGKQDKDDT
ncbi:NDUFAF4 -like protein [Asbolus verrucosus]|uniref:NDUFAF4-like protein n=1 Tax=Asbolus verrucosus TaxID=1661398 RepID=A0A482WD77_ASBVE|nr:NDUFAF4 -like protein [Asbolus verrucosus]